MACTVSKAWNARNVTLRSDLRQRGGGVAPQVAQEHRDRLRPAGPDDQARRPAAGAATRARRAPPPSRTRACPAARSSPATSSASSVGRDEAAAQVVEDLPAADERQRVALQAAPRRDEREQPEEDLPVAADPAVLAPGVGQHARRVLVDQLDVRHERDARVEPLEQVVRQQRVLRHRVLERRRERVDVVEPLAGEDAFAEQVLVGVGDRGRVRVDAGVARVEPREQRAGGARERDADARLQDAVALGDATDRRIERRRD